MGVTPPQSVSGMPTGTVGVVMGSVDDHGNITLTPLDGSGAAAASEAGSVSASSVYGTQNLNVRIYANPATVSTQGGTKTWTMNFGVRNLLPYPIGANQGAAAPSDTTGIFLAVISGPTVSKTSGRCSPCAMTTKTFDGKGNFTGPNQPYVYWHERLAAKQVVAGADTVSNRRTIQFTSPVQVTNATFFLMVGADWPPPAQTSWAVSYNAATDSAASLHAKPIWKTDNLSFFGSGTETWKTSGVDSIRVTNFRDYYLVRHDSLASNSSAYFEAHVRLNSNSQSNPETVFGFQDGARLVAIGLTSSQVGFIRYGTQFGFIPEAQFVTGTSQFNVNATNTHTYRLRKFGTDSVTLEVDGARQLKALYSQLSTTNSFGSPTEFFGAGSVSGNGSSAWSVVTYGIGATQP
jgi:hypothetical protein